MKQCAMSAFIVLIKCVEQCLSAGNQRLDSDGVFHIFGTLLSVFSIGFEMLFSISDALAPAYEVITMMVLLSM